jgi:hypothetical protein
MYICKSFLGAALLLCAAMSGCTHEAMLPTHLAQIRLDPSRYGDLMNRLDSAMKASGLSRYGAAPGLRELRGRDVLYVAYRMPSKKWAFITATDISKVGTVEMRVYSTVLTDGHLKEETMSRLDDVLAEFGSELKEQSTDPNPPKAI